MGWGRGATTVRGVGTGVIWVFSAVLLQLLIPDRLRGRVFAFEFAALTLTQALSTLWAGYATDRLDWTVQQVAASVGVVGIVTLGAWFAFRLWAGKQLEAQFSSNPLDQAKP